MSETPPPGEQQAAIPQAPLEVRCTGTTGTVQHFRWVAHNILKLNRKNKITSHAFDVHEPSAPTEGNTTAVEGHIDAKSPAPLASPAMKLWKFRCILLRGLEKADKEENDPIGIFIEYLPEESRRANTPPPATASGPSASSGRQSGTTSPAPPATAEHPKGTKITVRCRHHADPAQSVKAQESFTFDASDKTMAFRTFLQAVHLKDEHIIVDGHATFEFDIETGIPTLADTVSKTTEKISTSFWRSTTSAFSALSSGFNTLKQSVAQQLHAEAREEAPEAQPPLPWESVPPRWRGREDRWKELVTVQLPHNEMTFMQGPERGLSSDEQVLMAQVGLSHKAVMTANSMFNYDRDVHEGLLSLDALRIQRYNLVPRHVSDETFWRNYLWKVAAASACQSHEQTQVLLSILNAPVVSPPRHSGRGSPDKEAKEGDSATHSPPPALSDEEVAKLVKEAAEATSLVRDLLEDEEADETDQSMLSSAVSSCESSKRSIQSALQKLAGAGSSTSGESPSKAEPGSPTKIDPLNASLLDIDTVLDLYRQRNVNARLTAKKEDAKEKPSVGTPPTPVAAEAPGVKGSANSPAQPVPVPSDAAVEVGEEPPPPKPPAAAKEQAKPVVIEETVADPKPEKPKDASPKAASAASKKASSPEFDDFPELDDMDTPTRPVGATATSASAAKSQPQPGASTGRRSVTSSEFAKMPWEEDEDF